MFGINNKTIMVLINKKVIILMVYYNHINHFIYV